MNLRDLENRATQLAELILAMGRKAKSSREAAHALLIANGEVDTSRLNEAQRVSYTPAEFLVIVAQLEAWARDVRSALQVERCEPDEPKRLPR